MNRRTLLKNSLLGIMGFAIPTTVIAKPKIQINPEIERINKLILQTVNDPNFTFVTAYPSYQLFRLRKI